jgi:hypothetical protein
MGRGPARGAAAMTIDAESPTPTKMLKWAIGMEAPWPRLALLVCVVVLLAGCGIARSSKIAAMSPDQWATLSDHDICMGLRFNKQIAGLLSEAERRGLGDCSYQAEACSAMGAKPGTPEGTACATGPAQHHQCLVLGTQFGTPEYAQCRVGLAQARAIRAAANSASQPQSPSSCVIMNMPGSMFIPVTCQ